MSADERPPSGDEAFWREFLTRGDPKEMRARRVFRWLPRGPRCKLCAAPFAGSGSHLMRVIGKRPALKNRTVCNTCFDFMETHHGGAEIEGSFLFADIRGSTTLAERMPPTAFRALIDRFYTTATQAVFDNDGGVDKFVGDEIVAFFFPLFSGPRHAAAAVGAASALLRATGHADNIAAGLGGVAAAGEVLMTTETAMAAGVDPSLQTRSLDLKGKTTPTSVVSLTIGPVSMIAGG